MVGTPVGPVTGVEVGGAITGSEVCLVGAALAVVGPVQPFWQPLAGRQLFESDEHTQLGEE